jgi:leucyl-tRNA synthetase
MGNSDSVHNQAWPVCDETKLMQAMMNIAMQINGKLRDVISIPASANDEELTQIALSNPKTSALIASRTIRKVIVVKGKLVNIVC